MKYQRIAAAFAATLIIASPVLASAQTTTVDVSSQIQSLLSEIQSLQQQLRTLIQSAAPSSTIPVWNASSTMPWSGQGEGMGGGAMPCLNITRDLSMGSQGNDVTQLQQLLENDGFMSTSSTSGFFGALTAQALGRFQMQFGIASSSTGSFGPMTRNFFQMHCGQGGMGSSTPPAPHWGNMGSSTTMNQGPWRPQGSSTGPWMGTTTPWGPQGSSTGNWMPHGPNDNNRPPCMSISSNSAQGAVAAFFVPHIILPMMDRPCGGPTSQ